MVKKTNMRRRRQRINVPKYCYFCKEKKEPYFSDTEVLRRFISERAKIVGRMRSGVCAKHQRDLTIAIKHARQLALLPFIGQH